jgi:hypothetical protein
MMRLVTKERKTKSGSLVTQDGLASTQPSMMVLDTPTPQYPYISAAATSSVPSMQPSMIDLPTRVPQPGTNPSLMIIISYLKFDSLIKSQYLNFLSVEYIQGTHQVLPRLLSMCHKLISVPKVSSTQKNFS